jgi:hypothetical protein
MEVRYAGSKIKSLQFFSDLPSLIRVVDAISLIVGEHHKSTVSYLSAGSLYDCVVVAPEAAAASRAPSELGTPDVLGGRTPLARWDSTSMVSPLTFPSTPAAANPPGSSK